MKKTKFKDLFIVQNIQHSDIRGHFKELIRENKINKKFPFLVMSYSKKNVIRGLHLQTKKSQGKYVSVIKGKIYDVAIDLRKNSKTFGLFHKCILSSKNSKSLCGVFSKDMSHCMIKGALAFARGPKQSLSTGTLRQLEIVHDIFKAS